ncbi:MAG: hypothetical protein AAFN27_02225 [Pseudomonadota bacterium]
MNEELLFYRKVTERRVQLNDRTSSNFNVRAKLYIRTAVIWGEALTIKRFQENDFEIDLLSDSEIVEKVYEIEAFLEELKAKYIREIEPNLFKNVIDLDDDWKARATTLVGKIRGIVQKAKMAENLREPIFRSLNDLQSQLDKNRSTVEAISETWVQLMRAIGCGAREVEPAVKVAERLLKDRATLEQHQIEEKKKPPSLPSPPTDDLD